MTKGTEFLSDDKEDDKNLTNLNDYSKVSINNDTVNDVYSSEVFYARSSNSNPENDKNTNSVSEITNGISISSSVERRSSLDDSDNYDTCDATPNGARKADNINCICVDEPTSSPILNLSTNESNKLFNSFDPYAFIAKQGNVINGKNANRISSLNKTSTCKILDPLAAFNSSKVSINYDNGSSQLANGVLTQTLNDDEIIMYCSVATNSTLSDIKQVDREEAIQNVSGCRSVSCSYVTTDTNEYSVVLRDRSIDQAPVKLLCNTSINEQDYINDREPIIGGSDHVEESGQVDDRDHNDDTHSGDSCYLTFTTSSLISDVSSLSLGDDINDLNDQITNDEKQKPTTNMRNRNVFAFKNLTKSSNDTVNNSIIHSVTFNDAAVCARNSHLSDLLCSACNTNNSTGNWAVIKSNDSNIEDVDSNSNENVIYSKCSHAEICDEDGNILSPEFDIQLLDANRTNDIYDFNTIQINAINYPHHP